MRRMWIERLDARRVCDEISEQASRMRDLSKGQTLRFHRWPSSRCRLLQLLFVQSVFVQSWTAEIIASQRPYSTDRAVVQMPQTSARCKIKDAEIKDQRSQR